MARGREGVLAQLLMLCLFAALGAGIAAFSWVYGRKLWDVFARYSKWDKAIVEASRRNNVDPRLVKAVVWRESRFRQDAMGLAGEVGLMQVKPDGAAADWARINGVESPCKGILSNPELNIEIGSWYLGRAVRKWSSYKECFELALCEYNAGARRADAWKPLGADESVRERINISSTLSYVNSVMAKYDEYRRSWDPNSVEGRKR